MYNHLYSCTLTCKHAQSYSYLNRCTSTLNPNNITPQGSGGRSRMSQRKQLRLPMYSCTITCTSVQSTVRLYNQLYSCTVVHSLGDLHSRTFTCTVVTKPLYSCNSTLVTKPSSPQTEVEGDRVCRRAHSFVCQELCNHVYKCTITCTRVQLRAPLYNYV